MEKGFELRSGEDAKDSFVRQLLCIYILSGFISGNLSTLMVLFLLEKKKSGSITTFYEHRGYFKSPTVSPHRPVLKAGYDGWRSRVDK